MTIAFEPILKIKMTVAYSIDQRIASIARGLTGVAGLDEIRSLLEAGKTPKGFWGKMANALRAK